MGKLRRPVFLLFSFTIPWASTEVEEWWRSLLSCACVLLPFLLESHHQHRLPALALQGFLWCNFVSRSWQCYFIFLSMFRDVQYVTHFFFSFSIYISVFHWSVIKKWTSSSNSCDVLFLPVLWVTWGSLCWFLLGSFVWLLVAQTEGFCWAGRSKMASVMLLRVGPGYCLVPWFSLGPFS